LTKAQTQSRIPSFIIYPQVRLHFNFITEGMPMLRLATAVLCLATVFATFTSFAQQSPTTAVPNLIRYSGTLKDAQGAAPSGTPLGVTFAIYKQQEGGAPVWMETQNVTPDASGQYSVVLGSTTATGLPSDLFSRQEQRWLSVQVQGEAEQARVLLVSVPYAFKAQEAETLGGLPASAYVKATPSDVTGSGSTETGTAVNALAGEGSAGGASNGKNAAGSAKAPCSGLTGGGTQFYIAYWSTNTGCALGSSVIYQSPLSTTLNYVGIGTNTPQARLDVNGAINTSRYYQIGLNTVLSVLSPTSLSVGFGAGNAGLNSDTFVGYEAGNKSTGQFNTYVGHNAGPINTNGFYNTFVGSAAGLSSTTGTTNAFFGERAGVFNTTGSQNVFLGQNAGLNNTVGSNDVYLANPGGNANENNTTRIGFPYSTSNCYGFYQPPCGQNAAYIAGIYNVPLSPGYQQVIIDSTGHLGSTASMGGGVTGMCGSPGGYLLTKWLTSTSVQCTNITEIPGTFNVGINGVPSAAAQLDVVGGLGNANTTDTRSSYMISYHPVLSINPYGNGNLFVGADTGSGGVLNTFVGNMAGLTAAVNTSTFVGAQAGQGSTSVFSTFVGESAGQFSTGQENDFFGVTTGRLNSGSSNSFFGTNAGAVNTANQNVFVGNSTGLTNTTGSQNTFVGVMAGEFNVGGTSDIFIGFNAGSSNVAGSSNIDIGNVGVATDNGVIRIGNAQNATYIAGIYNSTATPTPPFQEVCVDLNGTVFGTMPGTSCVLSSLRFKDQIADMGDSSSNLFQLRPVTFLYKPQYDDGSRALQYGLIAEEVATVYPDLVEYDTDGQPYTVKYQLLAPMLLNELQKQHTVVAVQQDVMKTQQEQIQSLQKQNEDSQQRLSRLESLIAKK